jgi:hypothetical protein
MTPQSRQIRDGLYVGLIAYAAVASFYAAYDVLAARGLLFTVNMLGLAAFRGVRDPAVLQFPVPLDLSAIILYNALHLAASLVVGQVVVALTAMAERNPARSLPAFLVIVGGYVVTIAVVGFLSEPMRALLPWWSIVVANTAAVALAAAYLLRRRPGVWAAVTAFAR